MYTQLVEMSLITPAPRSQIIKSVDFFFRYCPVIVVLAALFFFFKCDLYITVQNVEKALVSLSFAGSIDFIFIII